MIPFNKPYLTGKETQYITEAVLSCKISGNGDFTKKCHSFFERRYGFGKCLLTSSCTDALEMAAILLDIQPEDEVILPSYTFVSTANAFVLRGARLVFSDSSACHPNIDVGLLENLITPKTRAIVVVHYAGMAVDMDYVMNLADKHGIYVVEDAAQAIDGHYKGRPLGSIGHLAAFSFHETKNIISGEGGMLVVNDMRFAARAEIIWEKGTNRAAFWRGEVDKYGWVDIGSSFLPSEIVAAFLFAQLEQIDTIQAKRKHIWNTYYNAFLPLEQKALVKLPLVPSFSDNNAHMFYLVFHDLEQRQSFIDFMKSKGVLTVFHYLSLHKSQFYKEKHDGRELPMSDFYSDCLVRLPLFFELDESQLNYIVNSVIKFFEA